MPEISPHELYKPIYETLGSPKKGTLKGRMDLLKKRKAVLEDHFKEALQRRPDGTFSHGGMQNLHELTLDIMPHGISVLGAPDAENQAMNRGISKDQGHRIMEFNQRMAKSLGLSGSQRDRHLTNITPEQRAQMINAIAASDFPIFVRPKRERYLMSGDARRVLSPDEAFVTILARNTAARARR